MLPFWIFPASCVQYKHTRYMRHGTTTYKPYKLINLYCRGLNLRHIAQKANRLITAPTVVSLFIIKVALMC